MMERNSRNYVMLERLESGDVGKSEIDGGAEDPAACAIRVFALAGVRRFREACERCASLSLRPKADLSDPQREAVVHLEVRSSPASIY